MRVLSSKLSIEEAATPTLKPGQALVKVKCFGVSIEDVHLYNRGIPISNIGTEFSGEVVEIVPESGAGLTVGDKVLGFVSNGGAMADHIVCDVGLLAKIPTGMTFEVAATILDSWVSASRLLKDDAQVLKRGRIAVYDAMSPIGQAITQLAQLIGCRRVHCITNSATAADRLVANIKFHTALVDEIIPHNTSSVKGTEIKAIAAYDPRGLEAVIDLRDRPHIRPEMLRPRGAIVILWTPTLSLNEKVDWSLVTMKNLIIKGASLRGLKPLAYKVHFDFIVEHVISKIARGKLYHNIAHKCSWRNVSSAFDFVVKNPEALGRVVCYVN